MAEEGLLTAESTETTWRDGIEEANRDGVKDFDSVDALAKGYGDMFKMMGSRIKMPTSESTPDEKSAFYQKLGRPDTAAGYTKPELADGESFDEEFLGEMAAVAHAEGVSDKQFRSFIDKYMGYQARTAEQRVAAENAEADTTQKQLHEEWAGDYDKNLEISKRALRELVPADIKDEFVELLKTKNLDNNLLFIKGFHAIGSKMMDDTLVRGDLPKEKEGYKPAFPKSPQMYETADGEEGAMAREWHRANGYVYSRKD